MSTNVIDMNQVTYRTFTHLKNVYTFVTEHHKDCNAGERILFSNEMKRSEEIIFSGSSYTGSKGNDQI